MAENTIYISCNDIIESVKSHIKKILTYENLTPVIIDDMTTVKVIHFIHYILSKNITNKLPLQIKLI